MLRHMILQRAACDALIFLLLMLCHSAHAVMRRVMRIYARERAVDKRSRERRLPAWSPTQHTTPTKRRAAYAASRFYHFRLPMRARYRRYAISRAARCRVIRYFSYARRFMLMLPVCCCHFAASLSVRRCHYGHNSRHCCRHIRCHATPPPRYAAMPICC